MTAALKPLSSQALKLSPGQRMGRATLLIDSLEAVISVDKRQLRELTKRAADLRSGKVQGLTTKQAHGFSL